MEGDTPVEAAKNLSRDAAKERHCPVLLDAKKDKDLSVAERVSMNIAKLLEEQKVSRRNVTGEVASLLPHADDIHYPCATLPSSTTPPVTMVRTGTTMEPDHKEEHVKMEPDHKEEPEEKLIKIATSTQTSRSNRKRSAEKEWSSVPSIAEMAKTRKRVKLTKPQTLAAATLPMRRRSPRVNALPVKKEGSSKLEVKTRDRQESKVREKPLKEESSNQEVKVRKEREIHKEKSVSKRTRQSQIKEETLKKESAGKTKERATKKQKLTDNSKEKVTSKLKKGTQQLNTEKEGRPNDQSTNVKIDLYKNIPKFKLKKHRESQIHWIAMFEELKEYIMKHGHAEVPKKHGELGNFVHNQRQHFPMQRLRAEMETSPMWKQTIDDRETVLRSIGYRFECNVNERKWSEKFDQLIQYKKDNGHLQIAQRHGKLGRWASQQKKYYAQGDTALTKERIDKLNGIGFRLSADKNFTWDFHWDNMFRKLLAYKKANGHSNPHRNEPLVGSWPSVANTSPERTSIAELKGLVDIVDGCETTHRLYIDPVLVAAGLMAKDLKLKVEQNVSSPEAKGPVDNMFYYHLNCVCATDGKKDQRKSETKRHSGEKEKDDKATGWVVTSFLNKSEILADRRFMHVVKMVQNHWIYSRLQISLDC